MTDSIKPTLFVIDDDIEVCHALKWLFESVNLTVEIFQSAIAFLSTHHQDRYGVIITDVCMPKMNGIEFLEQLQLQNIQLPVIVLTGHGDIPMAVYAMKIGAVDFISKPFSDQYLLDKIQESIAKIPRLNNSKDITNYAERYATLTTRERQIADLIIAGKLNKQIASELNISISTVELHRSRVKQKMQARTSAELVKMVAELSR